MWSIPVDRVSLDAVEQSREKLDRWQSGSPEQRGYQVQVTFDTLMDPAVRLYFKRVPTSLALPKDQVVRLREVARRLLRASLAFKRLLADLESGQ